MNGPEHYGMAEAWLRRADTEGLGSELESYCVATAQVHATLAVAAAAALRDQWPDLRAAWVEATKS